MALTSITPYTQQRPQTHSPLQTLARPRPAPAYTAYRPPVGDQGNPHDPAYPWYHATGSPLRPAPPTIDTQPHGGGGGGGGGGNTSAPGYENDPVYQQLAALSDANVADAQAQATASRKQLAIQLGDAGLANSLGLGGDTAYAAQNNPYSILANLLRGHVGNVQGINAGTNANGNLFFSSTRGKELGQEQTGYQGGRASAANAAQTQLAQIAGLLLTAQRQAQADKLNAARQWYEDHKGDTPPQDPNAPIDVTPDPMNAAQQAYAAVLEAARKRAIAGNSRAPGGV